MINSFHSFQAISLKLCTVVADILRICICLFCKMNGWMTCDFTSFLTVLQSYQDDVGMIMKGCVQ